ncbi:TPA: DUF2479 domain-containing protein [Clostridium perfringens]
MATYFIQNTNNVEDIEQMNNVINKVNKVNTEATSNIGQLTDLNNKATELSNNIQQALPLNSELVKNVESAKTVNNELIATNNDAKAKKTDLDNSLEEAKKYIAGLDGSQNIPQIRLDVDALQNGLKSNQALSYEGSSIVANETLEGRTEGMRICGRTLVNLLKEKIDFISSSNSPHTGQKKLVFATSPNKPFTFIADIKYTGSLPTQLFVRGNKTDSTFVEFGSIEITSNLNGKIVCVCKQNIDKGCSSVLIGFRSNSDNSTIKNAMILEGDWTNKEIPSYFEGLKSFGEAEKVEDKYKISILSGYNLIDTKKGQTGAYLYNNGKFVSNASYKFVTIEKNEGILQANNIASGIDIHITYWENENFINGVILNNGNNIKINPPSNCNLIKISFNVKITEIVFIKYNKKDILIKEPLKDDDVLYEDNGQVKVYRPTKQYTFTGDENFQKINVYGDVVRIDFACDDIKPSGYIISNNFAKGIIGKENLECINIHANSKYVQFQIKLNKLTSPDVEGFKAWLKANPTTIVYQLAEPVTEVVENCVDIDLDTFGEKTYFNILNSLPGTLDFKVPSNIASIVQNTAREVNNIWDVINNLLVPSLIDINKNVAMSTIKNNLK